MIARANALARGFSGIRPEVVELLIAALNATCSRKFPAKVPSAPAATSCRWRTWRGFLVGLGHVRSGEKRLSAAEALAQNGFVARHACSARKVSRSSTALR